MDPGIEVELVNEEVIDHVATLVAKRYTRRQIAEYLTNVMGTKFDTRMTICVISTARARLREMAAAVLDDERSEAIGFLKSIIRDDKTSVADRLKAQAQLMEIIGLGHRFNANVGANALDKARDIKAALEQMDASVNTVVEADNGNSTPPNA